MMSSLEQQKNPFWCCVEPCSFWCLVEGGKGNGSHQNQEFYIETFACLSGSLHSELVPQIGGEHAVYGSLKSLFERGSAPVYDVKFGTVEEHFWCLIEPSTTRSSLI